MASETPTDEYVCGHCSGLDHGRCHSSFAAPCACRAANHTPGLALARQMARFRAPDLAAAIMRGYYDDVLMGQASPSA